MRLLGLMGLMRPMRLMGPLGLLGLMDLMGCSGDSGGAGSAEPEEPPVETGTAISFSALESAEEEISRGTRASVPLSATATSFTVWGFKNMSYSGETGAYDGTQTVFQGYTVAWQDNSAATTTTNSSGWEYLLTSKPSQTIKFWDWSARAYRFFALTGEAGAYKTYGATGAYGTNGAYETHEYSFEADAKSTATAPYFSRLWFSTGDPVAYPDKQFGKPVTLEFLKPFARVRFLFKYVFPREGIKLKVIGFKPSDGSTAITLKGTVTVSYPTTGTATTESYAMTPGDDASAQLEAFTEDYDPEDDSKPYTDTDNGWYMVLTNPAQGSYTLTVLVNSEKKTAAVPAEYMQWLPGYSYTYIFKITDEGGVEIGWVESAVTPWAEMEVDRTVYNW
jgi:hypothetical protein